MNAVFWFFVFIQNGLQRYEGFIFIRATCYIAYLDGQRWEKASLTIVTSRETNS